MDGPRRSSDGRIRPWDGIDAPRAVRFGHDRILAMHTWRPASTPQLVNRDGSTDGAVLWHPALPPACGGLAIITAGIHLYWGLPRFAVYATVGTLADPRPFAFVASAHAILFAITLVVLGAIDWERLLLPGIALVLGHLLGYAAWHTVLSHGVGRTTGGHHDHAHATAVVETTVRHLVDSPLVLGSKIAELLLVFGLVIGYVHVNRLSE